MSIYFDNSRPERQKRARRLSGETRTLERSPIPKAKSYELFRTEELFTSSCNHELVCDTESYPNYFLAAFKCIHCKKVCYFEESPDNHIELQLLNYILHRFLIIGFNSNDYDLPMLRLALDGVSASRLKELSNELVSEQNSRKFDMRNSAINHIDIFNVAPITASLKTYGGRLHCERLQDLPYHHLTQLTREQAANVRDYCVNDLDITEALYFELLPHIDLRKAIGAEYNLDLRSKSDAQVAEALIISELRKLGPVSKPKEWHFGSSVQYIVPENLSFKTDQLKAVLELVKTSQFKINAAGSTDTPEAISNLPIRIGNCVYRMGNGGLHSSEKSTSVYATKDRYIVDRDVASYYPRILINQKLYPEHLGPNFLFVYEERIVNRRLHAKTKGQECKKLGLDAEAKAWAIWADGLKIAANGSFGKLGNHYSNLYSPDLVTQITVSGQLYLLILIERIELAGIHIISANTDGIVIDCPVNRYDDLCNVISLWEEETKFATEETKYRSLHMRDVNNYIAVKEDGTCKTKGIYCERGSALNSILSKNPECLILSDAVQKFVSDNTSVERTIRESSDLCRFVSVRSVKGGAEKDGTYLGKSVRWYYASGEQGELSYVLTGNKVPKTLGAKPCMILPKEIPDDLDYDWYINEAEQALYDLGIKKRPEIGMLL